MPEPLELAEVVASRPARDAADDWLARGFQTWLRAGGAIPLERCLRLGATPAVICRARRNAAIRRAWALLPPGSDRARAERLATELRRFTTAVLPTWQEAGGAPAGASRLRQALAEAATADPELARRGLSAEAIRKLCAGYEFEMELTHRLGDDASGHSTEETS